jgi:V/A-type H+-transporting ATPase subunit I
MAIVELDKVTLYGAASQKAEIIDRLQDLGCVHLVILSAGEGVAAPGGVSADCHRAVTYLKSCPEQRRQVRRPEQFDREKVVSDALETERRERELVDERDDLRGAIEDVEPWGDFSLPPGGEIGGMRFWFFVLRIHDVDKLAKLAQERTAREFIWREVARDLQNAYVVLLSEHEPEGVPGQLAKLDPRPLSQLQARLEEVEEELEELHHQRIGLTRWLELLANAMDRADDAAARRFAARQTLDRARVFAMQGWAPCEAAEGIRRFAEENGLAVTVEAPGPADEPPTLLQNSERLAGGEGLVTFYKTPEYRAWDPSAVAYFSFAVFFAMIMADAGYGAVIGLLAACYWKRMGQTQSGRHGRTVLGTVVVFAVVYGVLCGSYFGFAPSPESFLGELRILDAQSQELMMPLTIVVGVVHLSLANVVMAWLRRGRASALSSLGWVAVMAGGTVGGIGVFGSVGESLAGQLTRVGAALLVGGLAAVFLFSSDRPILSLSLKNHVFRVLDGLKGLAGLSGLFGDVLSYLRLFALGLSSAKLAETFNSLAKGPWDSAGFGVLAAIAIMFLGHTLNLLLSIMSGVVHGLRLNCIEFFKWSLPEEGYLFTAFAKKAR